MAYLVLISIGFAMWAWEADKVDEQINKLKTRVAELEKQYGVQGGK
jgi:hypothetical protein